jgi:VanZ family protein
MNDLLFKALHTGGGVSGDVLNLLLLFPLTISLVLASRRMLPTLTVAVLLPPAVELVQTQLPGRSCAISDMLTNGAGALLGVVVGWAAQRRLQRRRSGRPTSAAGRAARAPTVP